MTTPGQQLTPGDDNNPPEFGVPDGAYVGDASSPDAIQQLSHMTPESAKAAMRAPIGPSFTAQRDGIWGFFNSILSIVQGGIDLVVGAVDAVVNGIKSIFNSVGSLFGMSSRDMSAVDQARVDAENAIVARMSDSLEHLDEIQRVGGAYADYPQWRITWGEDHPHPIPLTAQWPLAQGTAWHPPWEQWGDRGQNHLFSDSNADRGILATLSGTLELQESGLWMIYFQVALLQGTQRTSIPADVWCYVTSNRDRVPVGTPVPGMDSYSRLSGLKSDHDAQGYDRIHTAGRAGSYLGTSDTRMGGGNTVNGFMMCYLDSPRWFIHMSGTGYHHFGGASSTFVFAQKVNSETLRDSIEDLKGQIADSLPGNSTPLDLTDAQIQAMVSQAEGIEVPEVEVPDE